MRKIHPAMAMVLTLGTSVGIVAYVLQKSDQSVIGDKIGFQDSARPLEMPETGGIDHRFQTISAWDVARIPTATRWDAAMGSEHGALTYNAQPFSAPNPKRGGPHLGDDLNGIGGMNTDLGDPIFACSDGLVVFAGEPGAGWGKTLILAHRTGSDGILHTMYAHLDRIRVTVGSLVPRGAQIGTCGTANGHYPAHLHLEIRRSNHIDINGGYGTPPLNRIDPCATIHRLRNAPADDLAPSPLAAMLRDSASWTDLEIRGAEHMPGMSPGKDP